VQLFNRQSVKHVAEKRWHKFIQKYFASRNGLCKSSDKQAYLYVVLCFCEYCENAVDYWFVCFSSFFRIIVQCFVAAYIANKVAHIKIVIVSTVERLNACFSSRRRYSVWSWARARRSGWLLRSTIKRSLVIWSLTGHYCVCLRSPACINYTSEFLRQRRDKARRRNEGSRARNERSSTRHLGRIACAV